MDPDKWEFANEGFLGGQKHLLKTIRRKRNFTQSSVQHGGGGPCVELGQFGMDVELERLQRDRNLLMAEVVKLKQQHHKSRELIMIMEERMSCAEKKQRQMMSFMAKAFTSPLFVQEYAQKNGRKRVEIGQKRRLTMSPSMENLENVLNVAIGGNANGNVYPNNTSQDQEGFVDDDQMQMETLVSAALDEESRVGVADHFPKALPCEEIWERMIDEHLMADDGPEYNTVEVEDLDARTPPYLGEGLQDLVDELGRDILY